MSAAGELNPEYIRKRRKVNITAAELEEGGLTGSDSEWTDNRSKEKPGKKNKRANEDGERANGDNGGADTREAANQGPENGGADTGAKAKKAKAPRFTSTQKERDFLSEVIRRKDKNKARIVTLFSDVINL